MSAFVLLVWGQAAYAQTPAPGQGLPTRDEITRLVAPPPTTGPRLRVEGELERAPCPLADPAYADIRVTLSKVELGTLKGMTEADLAPVYASYLGVDRPISDICEIRDAVATELRRHGYLAAVQVPTQEIQDGTVRFEVLYARLTSIRVRGDAGRSERLVAAYLQQLTDDEVFNQNEAERYLLLARDLPGLDVRLALKPAGAPGEVYGEITVQRTPVEADLNIQNFGSTSTGRFGAQARVQFNGLTGYGDQTTLALYATEDPREQTVLQLGHEMRVGGEGLTFSGRYTYAWTRPDLNPDDDLIRGRTGLATIEARYPFLRSQARSLWLAGGIDVVDQTVRFADVEIAQDRLRVAYLRLDGDLLDYQVFDAPRWHAAWSVELRQGLGIGNATQGDEAVPASRGDADAEAGLVRASISAERVVYPNVTLAASAGGQYAFDPLLSFEEFSAGTYTIGRGYDPGTLIGDDGLGLSLELRLDRYAPMRAPLVLQPFVFADAARVWNRGQGSDELFSYGVGVRASYGGRFRLDLVYAVPTEAAGLLTEREDPRLLVSFTTKLWPWSID